MSRHPPYEHASSGEFGSAPQSADQLTVRSAITRLPSPLRELLELGYYAGIISAEMETELSIPLGTVKSRVARALAELRAALGDGAGARTAAQDAARGGISSVTQSPSFPAKT
jgi:DNA-directed RNA polymerase specialized sigma24 family protein